MPGKIMFELSPQYSHVTVTPLTRLEPGYDAVKKCERCNGLNGITWRRLEVA